MAANKGPTAKEHIEQGSFKALYNKRYGDIARLGKNRELTPEQVFDLAVSYFSWAESNSLKTVETASFQGDVYESKTHKARIFTIKGFLLFACLSPACLQRWRREDGYKEVIEFVDNVIYEQKYQMAATNTANANFLAKDLEIDKGTSITVNNGDENAVSKEDLADAVSSVLGALGD